MLSAMPSRRHSSAMLYSPRKPSSVGFGHTRANPALLYMPPAWIRYLNLILTLIAFILVAAAYVPRNHFKEKIGHPMLAGVKIWAFGHLLSIGTLRDVVLFGAFLIWAIADFAVSRRRDRAAGVGYPAGSVKATWCRSC